MAAVYNDKTFKIATTTLAVCFGTLVFLTFFKDALPISLLAKDGIQKYGFFAFICALIGFQAVLYFIKQGNAIEVDSLGLRVVGKDSFVISRDIIRSIELKRWNSRRGTKYSFVIEQNSGERFLYEGLKIGQLMEFLTQLKQNKYTLTGVNVEAMTKTAEGYAAVMANPEVVTKLNRYKKIFYSVFGAFVIAFFAVPVFLVFWRLVVAFVSKHL